MTPAAVPVNPAGSESASSAPSAPKEASSKPQGAPKTSESKPVSPLDAPSTPMTEVEVISPVPADVFHAALVEFITKLTLAFPNNTGAANALSSLQKFGSFIKGTVQNQWAVVCGPRLDEIRRRDVKAIAEALSSADAHPLVKNIGIVEILEDPKIDARMKESLWRAVEKLTVMAMGGNFPSASAPAPAPAAPKDVSVDSVMTAMKNVAISDSKAPATTTSAAAAPFDFTPSVTSAAAAAAAAATAAKAAPVNPAAAAGAKAGAQAQNFLDGFTQAMPKVVESINDVLRTQPGENPLADLVRQYLQPQKVQPGLSNNFMANMMDREDPNVLQSAAESSGLDVETVLARLERLDRLERARAARRRGSRRTSTTK